MPPREEERMRKATVLVVAFLAALLALGAGTGLAQEGLSGTAKEDGVSVIDRANQRIQCTGVPCVASGNDDLVFERVGNGKRDTILLKGGDDQVRANAYANDRDIIRGSSGSDLIYVDDGDTRDRIFGGRGNDRCIVDARVEAASGCARIIIR
jgi:Ca2+-binding RTX toxin-like protein